MATQITNQANIAYNYGNASGVAVSNIATTTLVDPISADKKSVSSTYRLGETVTYVISVQNNGNTPLTGITATDNLGSYTTGAYTTVTPLTYANNASLYIGGVYAGPIAGVTDANSVTFTIPTLAAGANALIIFNANVNNFAPLAGGSTIVNTVMISGTGISTPVMAYSTILVENYANLSILKEMSPNPIADGDTITYTFTIHNYGNTPATDVVLTDRFDPEPSSITVMADGQVIPSSNYMYTDGLLTLPSGTGYSLTVPAASISQNPTTGVVTVSPGTLVITVSGTI